MRFVARLFGGGFQAVTSKYLTDMTPTRLPYISYKGFRLSSNQSVMFYTGSTLPVLASSWQLPWIGLSCPLTNRYLLGLAIAIYFHYGVIDRHLFGANIKHTRSPLLEHTQDMYTLPKKEQLAHQNPFSFGAKGQFAGTMYMVFGSYTL